MLVDSTYVPGATRIDNPGARARRAAWAEYPSTRPDVPLQFGGRSWGIKVAEDPFDPGPNVFTDSTDAVCVDGNGLHLRTTDVAGQWRSAEVYLTRPLGYGRYTIQVASRLDDLDTNTVAGLFLYASPDRELDFEFSGGALIAPPDNPQFVVQPYSAAGHLDRYAVGADRARPRSVSTGTPTASSSPRGAAGRRSRSRPRSFATGRTPERASRRPQATSASGSICGNCTGARPRTAAATSSTSTASRSRPPARDSDSRPWCSRVPHGRTRRTERRRSRISRGSHDPGVLKTPRIRLN